MFGGRAWHPVLPRPHAAEWLAQIGGRSENDRLPAAHEFLAHVLPTAEVDSITELMLAPDGLWDADTLLGLVRALIADQSSRPLRAVVSLCSVMVKQWTVVSGLLRRDGITAPLAAFPTLYSLLDVVESLVLESREDEKGRDAYWREMYMPIDGDVDAPPPGWTDDDEKAMARQLLGLD